MSGDAESWFGLPLTGACSAAALSALVTPAAALKGLVAWPCCARPLLDGAGMSGGDALLHAGVVPCERAACLLIWLSEAAVLRGSFWGAGVTG